MTESCSFTPLTTARARAELLPELRYRSFKEGLETL
jgi:hypothetical protein